ncbi:MAG: hypothetical protein KGV50_05900 [Gammaproteobacteria bacterium]|nr:hypothetical protein [Gammaproteobacteria bacterium]
MTEIINANINKTENKIALAVIAEFEKQLKEHKIEAPYEGATALDVSRILVTSRLLYTFQNNKEAMHELIDMHADSMKESVDYAVDMMFNHGTKH